LIYVARTSQTAVTLKVLLSTGFRFVCHDVCFRLSRVSVSCIIERAFDCKVTSPLGASRRLLRFVLMARGLHGLGLDGRLDILFLPFALVSGVWGGLWVAFARIESDHLDSVSMEGIYNPQCERRY
jgi:hypothetical protein